MSGFGAVFVDVDVCGETTIEWYDENDNLLLAKVVPPEPQGLSFVGAFFGGEAIVEKVVVKLGEAAIDVSDDNDEQDVVVLDDFLYGEPVPIL